MAVIINFQERINKKKDLNKIKLSTLKLTTEDVDVLELYSYIDKKYKVDMKSETEEKHIKCSERKELFKELIRVSKKFESKRVAWMVLESKMCYVYIKELDNIYKAERLEFLEDIKGYMYEYGIDYIMALEKIDIDTYRWVVA